MTSSTWIGLAATLLAATFVGAVEYRSRTTVVTAGFWFDDDVTYEFDAARALGGPVTAEERQRIKRIAREEVERAFADYRIRITEAPNAFYRVRVRQVLTMRRVATAGQSNVFGALGGSGAVSFVTLAAQAVAYAPPGATRDDIIDAIGRGVGRAAVHEFVHQILPNGPVHITQDRASYEFGSSDRPSQYYGDMRWSVARDALRERLGR